LSEEESGFESLHDELLKEEKELKKVQSRKEKSTSGFMKKEKVDEENPVLLSNFIPISKDYLIDAEKEDLFNDVEASEVTFCGFVWTHPLEKSPDYSDLTFDSAKMEEANGNNVVPVEVLIEKVNERTSKKNASFKFYSITIQDCDYISKNITVWKEDYDRFKDILQEGTLACVKLKTPDPGYNSYSLYAPPRNKRYALPPKDQDYRVVRMRLVEDFDPETIKIEEKDICDIIIDLDMQLE